jgi:hypothetical protein
MKDFLKDKPKETFEKAPAMPEDMKELQKQRQREMLEESMGIYAKRGGAAKKSEEGDELPVLPTAAPKMEQVTLPPAPKTDDAPSADSGASSGATAPAKKADSDNPPPPQPATRPREVEAPKKKGKKGTDEP